MEQTKVLKCGCGQTNYLVFIKGVWCYDSARHGKIEPTPAQNRCANCQQPLEALVAPSAIEEQRADRADPVKTGSEKGPAQKETAAEDDVVDASSMKEPPAKRQKTR
jgi:hypothetical protein